MDNNLSTPESSSMAARSGPSEPERPDSNTSVAAPVSVPLSSNQLRHQELEWKYDLWAVTTLSFCKPCIKARKRSDYCDRVAKMLEPLYCFRCEKTNPKLFFSETEESNAVSPAALDMKATSLYVRIYIFLLKYSRHIKTQRVNFGSAIKEYAVEHTPAPKKDAAIFF